MDLGTCVEVSITHIAKDLPLEGAIEWCAPAELPVTPPQATAAGGASSGGSGGGTDEGVGESGGGVGVCGTWEELHSALGSHKIDKLMWPWAGIALHAPMFKSMTASSFIVTVGSSVFNAHS